jgi:hypothetical protein
LVAAAVLLAGCDSVLGVRTFGVTFPALGDTQALPVVVTDHSLSVTLVDLYPNGLVLPVDDVASVPGMPNALAIQWLGGMCDKSVAVDVRQAARLTFTLTTDSDFGGCRLAGIKRILLVQLNRPVAPDDVELVPGP